MAFCTQCGSQMAEGVAFCGSCGARTVTAAAAVPAVPAVPAAPAAPVPAAVTTGALAQNIAGALAYALGPITGTAFLLIEPYKRDRFVRFHALQSILYSIAAGFFFSVLRFLLSLLTVATFGLGGLAAVGLTSLCWFAFFLFWLFLVFKAFTNNTFQVPYIGAIAATGAGMPSESPAVNGFLAYVLGFITGIILLVNESTKHDKFVRFHAFQSIFLSALVFVIWIFYAVMIVALALAGRLVFLYPVAALVSVAIYAYFVLLLNKAYHNEIYKIPVVGDLAAKQAGL